MLYSLTGCSVAKQTERLINKAEKNETAFNRIGRSYILKYGCLTDTPSVQYIHGKDSIIFRTDTVSTTVFEKVPCDSFTQKVGTKTVTVYRDRTLRIIDTPQGFLRVDTARYTIVDKTRIDICLDSLGIYKNNYLVYVEREKTALARLRTANLRFWSFLILAILCAGAAIYFKIKRKI